MTTLTKPEARQRRHRRVRGKVRSTSERPRLVVSRSNKGISAQLIDDMAAKTLAGASWLQVKSFKGNKTAQAAEVATCWRRMRSRRGSRSSCSTAAATCTTAVSRRLPMQHAREA